MTLKICNQHVYVLLSCLLLAIQGQNSTRTHTHTHTHTHTQYINSLIISKQHHRVMFSLVSRVLTVSPKFVRTDTGYKHILLFLPPKTSYKGSSVTDIIWHSQSEWHCWLPARQKQEMKYVKIPQTSHQYNFWFGHEILFIFSHTQINFWALNIPTTDSWQTHTDTHTHTNSSCHVYITSQLSQSVCVSIQLHYRAWDFHALTSDLQPAVKQTDDNVRASPSYY